jgi:hypothetical protein
MTLAVQKLEKLKDDENNFPKSIETEQAHEASAAFLNSQDPMRTKRPRAAISE